MILRESRSRRARLLPFAVLLMARHCFAFQPSSHIAARARGHVALLTLAATPDKEISENGSDEASKVLGSTSSVVLMRHGLSPFNRRGLFTGWCDVNLSKEGEEECLQAGRLLASAGLQFDVAHTSVLKRACLSLHRLLEGSSQTHIPLIRTHWKLNERHYGALQGYSKPHVESQLGSVVKDWRRGFSARPPAMDASHPHWEKINLDPRYRGVDVPVAESLEDTQKRVMEYWHDAILPDVAQGKKAIVVAHANTLRALIHELDGLNDESIRDVNIPTGRPFAYFLGDDMKPRGERDSHGFRGKYIDEMMRVDPATCLSFAHEQKVSCFEQWALDPLELQTECLVPQLPEGCQVDLT